MTYGIHRFFLLMRYWYLIVVGGVERLVTSATQVLILPLIPQYVRTVGVHQFLN